MASQYAHHPLILATTSSRPTSMVSRRSSHSSVSKRDSGFVGGRVSLHRLSRQSHVSIDADAMPRYTLVSSYRLRFHFYVVLFQYGREQARAMTE